MRKSSEANNALSCPECGQEAYTKMLSAPSFQLNGTGWYATDFKNNGKPVKAVEQKAIKGDAAPVSNESDGGGH